MARQLRKTQVRLDTGAGGDESLQSTQGVRQEGLHVRCPHCQNVIELLDDREFDEVVCPSCDSSFSLIGCTETASLRSETRRTIGHFRLKAQLGIGAFGSVWRADDTDLDRTVAVKIPRKGQLDATEIEQFFREARAAAQLHHPNIVSVHEVGREGDTVYIVSDCIDGLTLTDWLTGQRPAPREAAEFCVKIAGALQHAHDHGVIHRDLKPGNIILDRANEPHLTDFGLAKREAGEITMTVEGQILGTPAYMSPEQAKGEGHYVDRRTDVYSLGVILYELLTGERPFRGNTRMLLHQVLTEDAPSPRRYNAAVPKDLETICLKCLEKSPDKRYATAEALADDLQSYLDNKPIAARPIRPVARLWRWCQRKPIVAGLSASLALVMVAGTIISSYFAFQTQRKAGQLAVALQDVRQQEHLARDKAIEANTLRIVAVNNQNLAQENARRATASQHETQRLLYRSDMREAISAKQQNDVGRIRDLLLRHVPKPDAPDNRNFVWYHLWSYVHPYRQLLPHGGPVMSMDMTRDGRYLASVGNDGICKIWEIQTGREVRQLSLGFTPCISIHFSPDGT